MCLHRIDCALMVLIVKICGFGALHQAFDIGDVLFESGSESSNEKSHVEDSPVPSESLACVLEA